MLWSLLWACGTDTGETPVSPVPPSEAAPVPAPAGSSLNLARHPDAASTLSLPPRSRDGEIPEVHPCDSELVRGKVKKGVAEYRTTLPIRYSPVSAAGLVVTAPDGTALKRDVRGKLVAGTWRATQGAVFLRLPDQGERIPAGGCQIKASQSAGIEGSMSLSTSGLEPLDFAFRSIEQDNVVRTGVYLPPPGTIQWEVTLPERAVFETTGQILEPEIPTESASDGAELIVSVVAGGEASEAGRQAIAASGETRIRVDLSAWAGQQVGLQLRTEPGSSSGLDYVLLTEPAVFTPRENPRRVVLLFIDTLRPDHLGYYGYERDTSPVLDAWAADATRFTQAYGTSSWTLPSSQSVLSGLQPEDWGSQPHLAEALSQAGFYTAAFVTNINLTPAYDMGYGWSKYTYGVDTDGRKTIAAGLALLEENADRDVALMLHFVEPHLPYQEPEAYRSLWAGPHPAGLDEDFKRFDLLGKRLRESGGDLDAIKRYVVDRYDQNIRFLDAELARLFPALPEDATVVVFSDHGEEFWEHGGFEHGHALYEEVVRVVMTMKSPGLKAGSVDAPVSLLDVTPTVLDLVGIDGGERTGRSLVAAAGGDAAARAALEERPQVFGRLLHGTDAWATLSDDHKWISRDSESEVFDLGSDPGEQTDLSAETELAPYRSAMSAALGREVVDVWRLTAVGGVLEDDTTITISHPSGFRQAWLGYDPRGRRQPAHALSDGVLTIDHKGGDLLPLSLYLLPGSDDPTGLTLALGAETTTVLANRAQAELLRVKSGRTKITISRDVVPLSQQEQRIYGVQGVEAALQALGYIE